MNNDSRQLFEQALNYARNGNTGKAVELFDECLCCKPPAWLAMQAYYYLALTVEENYCDVDGDEVTSVEMKWMQCAIGLAERSIEIFERELVDGDLSNEMFEYLKTDFYTSAQEFANRRKYWGSLYFKKLTDVYGNDPQVFEKEMQRTYIPPLKCLERLIAFEDDLEDYPEEEFAEENEDENLPPINAESINLLEPLRLPKIDHNSQGNYNTLKSSEVDAVVNQINNLIYSYEATVSQAGESKNREIINANQKYKNKFNEINQIVEENKKTASQIRVLLQKYENSAMQHLQQQKISTLVQTSLLPPAASGNLIELAQRNVDKAYQLQTEITSKTMPKNVMTTFWTLLAVGFLFGTCAATSSQSGGIFILSLVFFGGIGAFSAATRWHTAKSTMQTIYADILNCKQTAEAALEKHEKLLIENARRNDETARKILGQETSDAEENYRQNIQKIVNQVKSNAILVQNTCRQSWDAAAFAGMPWNQDEWKQWKAFERNGVEPNVNVAFGKIETYSNPNIGLTLSFSLPALMSLNGGRGLLFKVPNNCKNLAISAVQSVMLRFLATLPPGMIRFTMFDPIGLGQNVAAFMPLGKFDDKLITSRAWSEPRHIEEELEKMTLHLQDVIQMRLRNEHKNIEEYNRKSKVPEPYRIVTAMDFPTNFSNDAVRRLISIAENGARCGVYPIVVVDTDLLAKNMPYNFNLGNLEQHLEVIEYENGYFFWKNDNLQRWIIKPDDFSLEREKPLIDRIIVGTGEKAESAMKVEVPFDELLGEEKPTVENLWQNVATTKDFIEVPLGPQNVEENQFLTFGKSGTAHHAIVIGRTGSGKTNLMDVIITASALKYSPDEIEFYLIDLKSGVGFKPYADARLPHAKVIAIDSEREFALSVLRGLIAEMDGRSISFRGHSVDNIKDYRGKMNAKMPRILLVVDEFQNLFLEDDQISRESSVILERLAREGRSFGIHVLLGSQSLAGKSANLSGATLGQFAVRIALMCSESDARAIMADDNPEARLLSRPGEAIYNDRNGLIEGNKRFQVALFKDEVRQKYLGIIAEKAKAENLRNPTVFEGNKLAQLEESEPLKKLCRGEWKIDGKRIEAWLGEPIKLSEKPTAVRFRPQAGNNLLVVSREENEGVGMLVSAWLSLALQHQPDTAEFLTLNLTNSEEPWFELIGEIGDMLPHKVERLNRHNLIENMQKLLAEINCRADGSRGDGKVKYLFIYGLQRGKDLRPESGSWGSISSKNTKEPSASELFAKILREGSEFGIHVLTWCDLANNLKRTIDRNSMKEFNFRIASMMSQEDSNTILENSAASRLDKPHRAIFYDEDRPGYLEKFRPFAIPTDRNWWSEMKKNLNAFHGKAHLKGD